MAPENPTTAPPHRRAVFATTHWSVVLKAGGDSTSVVKQALETLCQTYWFPLYAYVRRCGHSPSDAEDLTQGFFERLLRLESIADVRREKGKFRSFLLASMNHFLADDRERSMAKKRNAARTVPLDISTAETRYSSEPSTDSSPDRLFERQWAMALLESTLQNLREEYESAGKGKLFMDLRFALSGDRNSIPYNQLAESLQMSEESLRVAVHRLRQRYRQVLRLTVGNTVANPSEIPDELDYLRRVIAG